MGDGTDMTGRERKNDKIRGRGRKMAGEKMREGRGWYFPGGKRELLSLNFAAAIFCCLPYFDYFCASLQREQTNNVFCRLIRKTC